ncbi:beta strand repeat-containing protein [Thermodesulfobacteriota bacterium]
MEVPAKFRSTVTDIRYWLLAFIFVTISVFLVSCGGGGTTYNEGGGGGDGGTTSFQLIAPSNVITGQTTSISAYVTQEVDIGGVTPGRIAVPGVTVTFQIVINNSRSDLDAGSAVTGSDGTASVTYTAGSIIGAIDKVRVTVTGVADPQDADITVDAPGAGSLVVAVSASPNTIEAVTDAGANNQATITATVTSGGGAVANQAVTFTTTAGTICTPGPCVATTNASGVASVTLQSSTNLETADVKAQAGTASATTTVTFIAGPAADFELFASPPNLTADNNSTSTVTTVVTDSAQHLVADGTTVNFSTKGNSPVTDGTLLNSTTLFPPPTGFTVGGVATAVFKAGTTSGTVNIRASSGGANSDDAVATYGDGLITLIPEFVGSVTVEVVPSILTADDASIAQVIATVSNTSGFPVNAGTLVTFTHIGGVLDTDFNFTNPRSSVTTATIGDLGEVSIFLRSNTTAGTYFVTATSGGRSATAQVDFIAGPADAGNSELTVSPNPIDADGVSTAVMTLEARDSVGTGNAVANGKTVGFSANDPGVVISNQTTTLNGFATATLTSTNTPGTVTLYAAIDTIVEETTITFDQTIGGNPNTIELALSDTVLTVESPTGSDAINITATVYDTGGLPLGVDCNNNIIFAIEAGPTDISLDGVLQDTPATDFIEKTTDAGVASVVLNAGITPGTVRLKVTANQTTGDCATPGTDVSVLSTAIIIASGPAFNIFVFPDSEVIDDPDSSLTSQIFNAMVTDQYGNPVENGTAVAFDLGAAAPAGVQVCATGYTGTATETDACQGATTAFNGVARTLLSWPPELIWTNFTLYAETSGGTVAAPGYVGTFPAVADVNIAATVNPTSVTGSCGSCINVSALYEDGSADPNPLIGRTVTFSSSNTSLVAVDLPDTAVTDIFGQTTPIRTLSVTCGAFVGTETVTITAAESPYFGEATLGVTCP